MYLQFEGMKLWDVLCNICRFVMSRNSMASCCFQHDFSFRWVQVSTNGLSFSSLIVYSSTIIAIIDKSIKKKFYLLLSCTQLAEQLYEHLYKKLKNLFPHNFWSQSYLKWCVWYFFSKWFSSTSSPLSGWSLTTI